MDDGSNDRDLLVTEHLRWARVIAAAIWARVPRTVDVNDLIQDAFLGLLMAAGKFDPRRGVPFRLFARAFVEGAVIGGMQSRSGSRRRHRLTVIRGDESVDGGPTPFEEAADPSPGPAQVAADRDELRHRLSQCTPRIRRILVAAWNGMTRGQIARALGLSEGTIYNSLKRAGLARRKHRPPRAHSTPAPR